MEIGTTEVLYIKNYTGNEVTSITAEVRIPATDGDVSGYIKLGKIDGWILTENDTKLSKTYTTNQTEAIEITMVEFNGTTFDGATTYESIEVYDISASQYVRVIVEYVREVEGNADKLTKANIMAYIKDNYIGDYVFGSSNMGWTISEDGTFMSKDMEINGNFMEPCYVYPAGETESDENKTETTISYKVDNVGLTITEPLITYTEKKSDEFVFGVEVSVTVPYTKDDVSGDAILGGIDGWILTKNNTKLVKTFLENTEETISIPVIEANGYSYATLTIDSKVVVGLINYKKTVKGRCDKSMCLYDVYTKYEVERIKIELEQQIEELKARMS